MSQGPKVKTGQFLRLALRYVKPHVRREAEMFVYMLLGLGFTMVFPFAFKNLLDTAIPSGQFSKVAGLLGVLGAAFVVSLLADLRRAYLRRVRERCRGTSDPRRDVLEAADARRGMVRQPPAGRRAVATLLRRRLR